MRRSSRERSPEPDGATRAKSSGQNVRGHVVRPHAVDEDDVALGILGAQPQDLLIRGRPVPTTSCRDVWKLDDDRGAGPASFEQLDPSAVYDESASERPEP